MLYELRYVEIEGQKYDGLFSRGRSDLPVVMHLHGTAGNFYHNRFVAALGELYHSLGYGYLTINLPGYEAHARDEDFTASRAAISAWREAIGAGRLILQGHSLGALKALDYLKDGPGPAGIERLLLLSPFDIVAFYARAGAPDEIEARRRELRAMAADKGGGASVPKEMFDYWDMSIGTMLAMLEDDGPADRFPSRDPQSPVWRDWAPSMPALVIIGGDDFAAYPDPAAAIASVPRSVPAALIDGAPHNFDGRTDTLRTVVSDWLKGG